MVYPLAMMLWAATLKRAKDLGDRSDAAADEELAARKADREWTQGERQRITSMRSDLASAGAPRTVDSGESYQPTVDDNGKPMPANPTIGMSRVSGGAPVDPAVRNAAVGAAAAQAASAPPNADGTPAASTAITGPATGLYRSPAEAATVAQAANDPRAQMARAADVYAAHGEPLSAIQMRTAGRQEQVAGLQLDQLQRQALNQKFDDDLNRRVNNFGDLEQFINDSRGDGQNGALKVKVQPSSDGKKVSVMSVNPADGSLTNTGQTFDNSPEGLVRAKAALSLMVSPEGKLTHLHQQAQEQQAAAKLVQDAQIAREQMASHERATAGSNAATVQAAREHVRGQLLVAGLGPDGQPMLPPGGVEEPRIISAATRFKMTGEMPPGVGRGTQGPADLRRIEREAARQDQVEGISPEKRALLQTTAKKTLQAYSPGGKEAANLDAVNTSLNHLETMLQLSAANKRHDNVVFNDVAKRWAIMNGQPVPKTMQDAALMIGPEITKAVVGTGGGVGERGDFVQALDGKYSADQIEKTVANMKELLAGRLQEKQRSYERGTGLKDFTEPGKYLSPAAAEVLQRRSGGGAGATGAGTGAPHPATNAKGWGLQRDAKGNMAYVSPDGKQFEEVAGGAPPVAAPAPAPRAAAPVGQATQTTAAPAAQATPTTPAAPRAQSGSAVDTIGQQLDAARNRVSAATQALMQFGSTQKARNPAGYQAAQAEAQAAKSAAAALEAQYGTAVDAATAAQPAAFGHYAKP